MNEKYKEAIDENCQLVLIETNPFVDFHVYSRTVLENIYEYFEHWKSGTQRLLFDSKKCDKKRGRSEEKTVSLRYLQNLYYEHQILNQMINPHVISNDGNIYDNNELHDFCSSLQLGC